MGRKNKCAKKLKQRGGKLASNNTKQNKKNNTTKQAAVETSSQVQPIAIENNSHQQDSMVEITNHCQDIAVETDSHQENSMVETNNHCQDNAVETHSQSQDIGVEQTDDFVITVPATEAQALEIANEASRADFDPTNHVFFTYGASVPEQKTRLALGEVADNNQELKRLAGAAAIYRQPPANNTKGRWRGEQWALGHCETTSGADAEIVAISECLSIAAKELAPAKDQKTAPRITIITHDQDATNQIGRVRYIDPAKGLPEGTPALLEIVKKSQRLRQSVGAVIELLCVPQHALELQLHCNSRPVSVKGDRLAEAAARKATAPRGPFQARNGQTNNQVLTSKCSPPLAQQTWTHQRYKDRYLQLRQQQAKNAISAQKWANKCSTTKVSAPVITEHLLRLGIQAPATGSKQTNESETFLFH